jgi:hypothetical protein
MALIFYDADLDLPLANAAGGSHFGFSLCEVLD